MSNEEFKKFISFLVVEKHVQDPDVLLFKGVLDNDVKTIKQAINDGANVNVTDTQVIKRYTRFLMEHMQKGVTDEQKLRDKIFEKFILYLIDVKHVQDPDVQVFKAVFENDGHSKEKLEKAFREGADLNVTDTTIIRRYNHFYTEFIELMKELQKIINSSHDK